MTDAMTKHPLYLIMNYQRLSRLLPTCTTGQSSRQLRYVGVPFVLLAVMPISAVAVIDVAQSANFEQKTVEFNQLFTQNDGQQKPLLDDAHVDETLTALRLKQAVEAGIIDEKVLEDYRKNTLKSLQSTQTVNHDDVNAHNDVNSKTNQGQLINVDDKGDDDNDNDNKYGQDDDLSNGLPADGLPQASSWQNLQQAAKHAQTQQYHMQSIQELEQHAQQVATYTQGLLNSPKSVPVAKLDNTTPNVQLIKEDTSTNKLSETAQQINDVVEQNQQDVQTSLGQFGFEQIQAHTEQIEQQPPTNAPNQTTPTIKADKSVNVFKRLYANLFSDGYLPLPKLDANIYLKVPANDGNPDNDRLVKVDTNSQPAKNIKASLEDLFVESVADFKAALPKIRETAKSAAEAVGYYDVQMQFVQTDSNSIDVIIDSVGEPVIVDKRVVEVRNIDGSGKEPLTAMQDYLPPLQGEVFNHGIYEASKQAISQMGSRFGYFDASWLSHSVDIVLPDNTADIALLYDAGQQYDFGDVVFFTYDKDSQKLTTDPNKLPVKPELLQQLLTFKTGENYHAPAITKFSNDLSATRYFNTVNVETVLPQRGVQRGVQAGVPSETTTDDDNLNLDGLNQDNLDNDAPDGGNSDNSNLDNSNPDNPNNLDNLDNDNLDNLDGLENIAPIEFEIDTDIENKLFAIEQKAQQLYNQPDDRVLLEDDTQSTTLLGKISDKISDIAGKLDPLPDNRSEHVERPVLANKITPEQVYDSKKVPVYVYVQSDKPRDAQVGFGYGTDSGMRLTGRLDYNLVNRDGYQAGVQTSLSKINKNVSAYVSRPWKHPLDDTIKANVKYEEELIDQGFGSFSLQSKSILAGLLRNVIKDSGWNRTYSIRYRYDDLSSDINASFYRNLPIRFAAGNDTQQALLFGYGLSKTEADDPINPNFGVRQYYSVEGGAKSMLTDTNMIIAKAGVSGVYGFGEGLKHQVIGGLDGGYIWAKDFFEVPYKLRFFAGGDQSIRGYDYNSLSPLEFDYLYGGQVLAVASFEYNYEFFPGFRGAVFADVGNAYDANFTTDTKVGAGFGIRWASPVGPVRVDLAAGVSENDPPIRLHFFIGSPLR